MLMQGNHYILNGLINNKTSNDLPCYLVYNSLALRFYKYFLNLKERHFADWVGKKKKIFLTLIKVDSWTDIIIIIIINFLTVNWRFII